MEWWVALLFFIGGFIVVMLSGLPLAFAFMLINIVGAFYLWGGGMGVEVLITSIRESLASFILVPLVLFILLGEVAFQSGLAVRMLDALDKWLGRLPGRLGLLAVGGGAVLSTLTGVSTASVAILGMSLVPEMEKRGYKKPMSLGPILGSGSLAIMIPPTALGVLLAALAQISVGRLLIAIIIPGVIMAVLYGGYIIIRCWLQPSVAPSYDVPPTPLREKLMDSVKYVLPLGFIIFLVTGVIFFGIATPEEAAATGTLGAFILAAYYRRLNWGVLKNSLTNTIKVSAMMLLIISSAEAFGQLLAFSGASKGMIQYVLALPLSPLAVIIAMQVILLFMGTFMSNVAIMMITLPIFMPIVNVLGFDPVWFGVIYLLNMEMSVTSPPFGLTLYVMKGVAPPDTTMGDIFRAALPFLYCDLVAMVLMLAFPAIALWLPNLMY